MITKRESTVILLFIFFFISSFSVRAFSFQPISHVFTPSGSGSNASFQLSNPGNDIIAVQLRVKTREINEFGEETNKPADEGLFSIYPSRAVLRPRSSQVIRVRWTGPAELSRESAFRLFVEQVPVSFDRSESPARGSVNIMFRYLAALYVRPSGAKADVMVSNVRVVAAGEEIEINRQNEQIRQNGAQTTETDTLLLVFENRGKAHAILANLTLTLTSPTGRELTWGPEDLPGLNGKNILSHNVRYYYLQVPVDFMTEETAVSLRYHGQ